MNFIVGLNNIKFIKFKPIIKFKKFERHNYDKNQSQVWWHFTISCLETEQAIFIQPGANNRH